MLTSDGFPETVYFRVCEWIHVNFSNCVPWNREEACRPKSIFPFVSYWPVWSVRSRVNQYTTVGQIIAVPRPMFQKQWWTADNAKMVDHTSVKLGHPLDVLFLVLYVQLQPSQPISEGLCCCHFRGYCLVSFECVACVEQTVILFRNSSCRKIEDANE